MSPMDSMQQVPVAEGLFEVQADGVRLIGTHCRSCGSYYFPKALSCRNPLCRDKQIEDTLLGPHGTLYSYTRQAYQPPALFRMENWAPYAIGLVELPQGLRVMGMMCDCPSDALRIGMSVQLTVQTLFHDDEGRAVLTYKFKPAEPSQATGVSA